MAATFVGTTMKSAEYREFELEYEGSVAKVAAAFQQRIDIKLSVAKTFSAMITSRCKFTIVIVLTLKTSMKGTAHRLLISSHFCYQMVMLHKQR